jgi:hypothetical protein
LLVPGIEEWELGCWRSGSSGTAFV